MPRYFRAVSCMHTYKLSGNLYSCFHSANLEVSVSANVSMNQAAVSDTVTLTCVIAGDTNATDVLYTWTHIDNDEMISEESNVLVLSEISIDQFGTYQCNVMADGDTASGNITITPSKYPYADIQ